MFIGAINTKLRRFLAGLHPVFDRATIVVGCSGNFTSEATLTQFANPLAIHSNDVSLYSCMLGFWLTGQAVEYQVVDGEFDWLNEYLDTGTSSLAVLMVLLDMLEFEKRNNPHRVRMWQVYRTSFADLVAATIEKLNAVQVRVDSFFAGDVMTHFERFADDPSCIFCCYAPTYSGGYEKLYKRLDTILSWNEPTYPMLDDERRNALLEWMSARRYLWYDDRKIEGREPVLMQRRGRNRTVYLYSNVVDSPALFADIPVDELPKLPYAPSSIEITLDSTITVKQIKTSDLALIKDAYLGKNIDHGPGGWAFAVYVNGWVIGFFEFAARMAYMAPDDLYIQADFPVTGTGYKRLSKLIIMLVVSGETRMMMERIRERRIRTLISTAFTPRPVSMKYRGVMKLVKRGETKDGQKFLNYKQDFNDLTWKETLHRWMNKYGSVQS